MGVRIGWLEAADVETAEWSDGVTLSLDGVPDAEHSDDDARVAWAKATRVSLAGLKGQTVPVSSDDVSEIDGLYKVVDAGATSSPLMLVSGVIQPPTITLQRLATGSVKGEVSSAGAMLPVVSPVTFNSTSPRVGVPGDLIAHGPSVSDDESVDLDEGRVRTVAMVIGDPRWSAFACSPDEWLAGSPRIEILIDSVWWPIHGQPPAGVPVRVHNGRVGLRIKSGGQAMAALRIATNGTVDRTYPMSLTDSGGLVGVDETAGVEVVRADSEMVWVSWTQHRNSLGTRQAAPLTSDLVIRRGMPGFTLSMSKSMDTTITATNNGAVKDTPDTTTIGAKAGDLYFLGQQSCTVSGTTSTQINSHPLLRIGTETFRTRPWAAPSISVIR